MNPKSNNEKAFEIKRRSFKEYSELLRKIPEDGPAKSMLNPFDGSYESFKKGSILNLEAIRLRWIKDGWFEYIPDKGKPFGFKRPTGEVISPGSMFTDGGSIPRVFWWKRGLSPWEYCPAYLAHDWLFDLQKSGNGTMTFEAVRDTMMEAIRTLMEAELAPKNKIVFTTIFDGIDSFVARRIWSGK